MLKPGLQVVLTSPDGLLARLSAGELAALSGRPVLALAGGRRPGPPPAYRCRPG